MFQYFFPLAGAKPPTINHAPSAREKSAAAVSQSTQECEDISNINTVHEAEGAVNVQLANAAPEGQVRPSKHAALPPSKAHGTAAEVLSPSSYLVTECR